MTATRSDTTDSNRNGQCEEESSEQKCNDTYALSEGRVPLGLQAIRALRLSKAKTSASEFDDQDKEKHVAQQKCRRSIRRKSAPRSFVAKLGATILPGFFESDTSSQIPSLESVRQKVCTNILDEVMTQNTTRRRRSC